MEQKRTPSNPFDTTQTLDLTGQLLIAMPGMTDQRFSRAVIFICKHNVEGAMGLVINRPCRKPDISAFMENLAIEITTELHETSIFIGGPVQRQRGFVLHSPHPTQGQDTLFVTDGIMLSNNRALLRHIAHGKGPKSWLIALGYSGWGPGQLETELKANAWLSVKADEVLVFSQNAQSKWENALHLLGVSPQLLSAEAGTA